MHSLRPRFLRRHQPAHRRLWVPLFFMGIALVCTMACGPRVMVATPCRKCTSSSSYQRPAPPYTPAAIAHAGVTTSPEASDGCRRAVELALEHLARGGTPVDAAVRGVASLEDDPRFNAGTGSLVRLDGSTIQMDASVMDSHGRYGAVTNIERVKNPIVVARALLDTPHRMLAGAGATAFARTLGLPEHDVSTPHRVEEATHLRNQLLSDGPEVPDTWRGFDWKSHWNFDVPAPQADDTKGASRPNPQAKPGSDTVGVAVRGSDGTFAAALSTGGWTIALRGRVGDVPIRGAGLFASPFGAAAATGTGERIIDEMVALSVVWQLAEGAAAEDAGQRVVDRLKQDASIGIIIITPKQMIAVADRPMAWAAKELGSPQWLGP